MLQTKTTYSSDRNSDRKNERGNVFLFILMGIVLFAALSFTISKGFRSQTTDTMSNRDAQLAATDIMNFVQSVERGVNRLRRKSVSESDISFDNNAVSGYAHGSTQPTSNHVFHVSGAGASWRSPPVGANDGTEWIITGASCVTDLNNGASGCDADSDISNEELLIVLPNVLQSVCEALNDKLNITGIPANTDEVHSTAQYKGAFANSAEITITGGPFPAVCYSLSGTNHFYYTLMAR